MAKYKDLMPLSRALLMKLHRKVSNQSGWTPKAEQKFMAEFLAEQGVEVAGETIEMIVDEPKKKKTGPRSGGDN